MAWSGYQRFLAVMMVVTGSINTLSTKWADTVQAKGSDGQVRTFEHPFLQVCEFLLAIVPTFNCFMIIINTNFFQASAMFLGEMLCLLTFKLIYYKTRNTGGHQLTEGNQNFNPFILMPAAMFDLVSHKLFIN